INGKFVKPHGTELFDLINPSNNQLIGQVTLADQRDTQDAIYAAKEAFKTFSKTTKEQRSEYLQRLHEAVLARVDEITDAMVEEYGAPFQTARMSNQLAANSFLHAKEVLKDFDFNKNLGKSKIILEPIGVTAIITPWNANASFICNKLATAIAAGCTVVIKPV
ncbi:aldehyde dehydrogenase family protein, partial [archaeon]